MADAFLWLRALVLLGAANTAPIAAKKLLGERFATPLDGGLRLPDGKPLLGMAKTIRGIVAAIGCTALAALPLGLSWHDGAAVGALAMAGDLASSFVKRRLGLGVHARATLLDQIPEALLPILMLQDRLGLGALDIVVVLALFVILEILLSRILFALNLRDRPY